MSSSNSINSMIFQSLKAPLFIAWQINSECNLDCLHCCEEAGHSIPGEMNREEVFNFLSQIVDLSTPYVAISGGEPLLHPLFFDICEFIRKYNISLKVETNGEFIDEDTARRFSRLKFRSVQISLDGATAHTHQALRLSGDFSKVISACKYLVRESVNTEIVFVPTKFNIHEIGELIDLAYSLGISGVYTGKTMRIGRAAQNWEIICPSSEEYEKFFSVLKEKMEAYDGKMKVYYYPYDVLEELKIRLKYPAASLLILPNGKVKLIGPLPFLCGDLKKQTLSQVWENYKHAWQKAEVIGFAQRVIADPRLLAEANRWREL